MSTPTLAFTGERFVPECQREIGYEHWHRYYFARTMVAHKQVLDIASGEGFGSHLLAEVAAQVIGLDIDPVAVNHANHRYAATTTNLNYQVASCEQIPLADASLDVVISFETLEHIHPQAQFLAEIRRVLRPHGILLISSPNKHLYTDVPNHHNPYHVRELYRDEFEALLATQFPVVHLLGQKLLFHSALWSLNQQPPQQVTLAQHDGPIHHEALYFLAVCAAHPADLPPLSQRLWLYDDPQESVYQHYNQVVREYIEVATLYQQQTAEMAGLKAQLAELTTLTPLARAISGLQRLWRRW